MNLTTEVKLHIYNTIVETTRAPTSADVASALNKKLSDVQSAFKELSEQRLLVLEPGQPQKIRMAPPFSAIPTIHSVAVDSRSYFANCAWDAFGIAAALHKDVEILSSCQDCGDSILLEIRNFRPVDTGTLAHFAVPAAQWWDEIIET